MQGIQRSLPGRARCVVIGGGIAGCSVLYHLARLGWTDSLLLEKGQLTCGSTWHAAGLCTQYHSRRSLMRLLKRSVDLYEGLRDEHGNDVGLRRTGSLRLATSRDQLDEYAVRASMARGVGIELELVSSVEAAELFPLARFDDVLAAAYIPSDGSVDASMATQALAYHARTLGATVVQGTAVTGLSRTAGGWSVETPSGTIECEVVVDAAGQWAKQVGRLAGARLPIVPLQHHYVVTDELAAVQALERDLPVLRDPQASFYARREGGGLLVGPFEPAPLTWAEEHVPEDFEGRLLPSNLEQILPVLLRARERIPELDSVGLKHLVNGPDGYTPDGLCLMGEVPGLPGFHVLAGFSIFGIVMSGGAGAYLAEWIVDGQPSEDMWDVDVRRFGPYAASTAYTAAKARQVYEREYAIQFPEEELPACRPLKTGPLYDRLADRGAVYGERFGWERPLFFAAPGAPRTDDFTFRVPRWHDDVGRECAGVRGAVGVLDQTSFTKLELSGPGAHAALSRLCANRIHAEPGRIALTQMLTPGGGIEADVTVTCLAPDRYYVVSAAAAEAHDEAWIARHLPADGGVRLDNVTAARGVLTLAGPRSRELLARITTADVGADALRFFRARELHAGPVPVLALRIAYVGELGFELHHPVEYSRALHALVEQAGEDLGLVHFGYRALDSMRLEKAYRLWGTDVSAAYTPLEAGLERLIDWDKPFIGRDALLAQREAGVSRRLLTLAAEPGELFYPHRFERVLVDGTPIAWVEAGGYGHRVSRALALSYLPPDVLDGGARRVELESLGRTHRVEVVDGALYDPGDERLR